MCQLRAAFPAQSLNTRKLVPAVQRGKREAVRQFTVEEAAEGLEGGGRPPAHATRHTPPPENALVGLCQAGGGGR